MKRSVSKYLVTAAVGGVGFLAGAFVMRHAEPEPLTVGAVQEAGKVIGQSFSNAEADSMINMLQQFRTSYDALHKLNMPNSVVPAMQFNPLPVGFVQPDSKNAFKLPQQEAVKLPADKDELAFYSIRQLAYLIKTRQISSVQLTRFFFERIKRYDPKLLFAVTITDTYALKKAAEADAEIKAGHYRGLLHGIPFGAKDLLAQKDHRTTFGSKAFKDQQLNIDATVITRLEAAGAILLAKTTLGELAMGDVWFGGKTRNPWDPSRGSSGSSAGSSSAVSAGCLPYAIGSETLGSIVSPATECGVTGLRPTYGRVSKYGAMTLSWSMDKLGPITRNAEDAAIVFNAIQGTDDKDHSTIAANFDYDATGRSLKGYKIGYLKRDFERNGNHDTDSATLAKLRELGAELVPLEYPPFKTSWMTFILDAEAAAAFQDLVLTHRTDLLVQQNKNAWPNIFRASQFITAVEYLQANRARTLLIEDWYKRLKGLDLYVTPTYSINLAMTNLTGNPCVVLPNGFNKAGRPYSITFMGQLFGEAKLLQAARLYQNATSFHKQHPKMNF
ncbi:amidase [Mucilaginibacter daejeonensis]|uniref:amidase n=1 Tax=Mucilaginibacter daejeonensis TaxID=398049 RepID=UPI001D174199|nr:amidase [Mucilaginibacter daejeonensis]UEG53575.1 amidase [Mucilaginibacter daejeonensis]